MRVTIKNYDKTFGLFFRKTLFFVELTLEFTNEELTAVRKKKLGHVVLYQIDRDMDGRPEQNPKRIYNARLDDLIRGRWRLSTFDTKNAALKFESDLREKILPNLKAALTSGGPSAFGSETFEL